MCCSICGDVLIDDDRSGEYRLLLRLEINGSPSNIPHLTNSDAGLCMPSNIKLSYYSTHEFHNNPAIDHCFRGSDSFSTLHCNIRSLLNMLKGLHYKFSVTGLT